MALESPLKLIKSGVAFPRIKISWVVIGSIALQFCNYAWNDRKDALSRIASLENGERQIATATQQRADMGDMRYRQLISEIEDVKDTQIRTEKKLDDLMLHMMPTRTADATVVP